MNSISRRLEKVERQLDLGEVKPCIFEIPGENGTVQRIQIDNLPKLLDEINGTETDPPCVVEGRKRAKRCER
jgi:hypothetical protein